MDNSRNIICTDVTYTNNLRVIWERGSVCVIWITPNSLTMLETHEAETNKQKSQTFLHLLVISSDILTPVTVHRHTELLQYFNIIENKKTDRPIAITSCYKSTETGRNPCDEIWMWTARSPGWSHCQGTKQHGWCSTRLPHSDFLILFSFFFS